MQSPSSATSAHPAHLGQPWANPAHMYPNSSAHHRADPTNPRSSYSGTSGASGQAANDDQYAGYQQQAAGFGGGVSGMANYSNSNYGSNVSNLYNTSPSLPSGSRRTSNPKASPPAPAAVNTSPSAYYARQSVGGQSDVAQSPYQQQASAGGQQVNVSPQQAQYGGYAGYPYHGEQYGHHQGGQWQQHQYHQQQSGGFPQQAGQQQRQTSAGSVPAGAGSNASESAASRGGAGSSFDYPGTQAGQYSQGQWDQSRQGAPPHQWQQAQQQAQQSSAQQGRAPGSSGGQQPIVSPWQGYGNHQPFPPPAHPVPQMGGHMPPGQYGWNQQWSGQGYYPQPPPGVQQPPPPPVAATAPGAAAGKKAAKGKKEGKKAAAAAAAAAAAGEQQAPPPPVAVPTDQLLGKRAPADGPHEDAAVGKLKGKSKMSKKEDEKPVPKAPTKSHLKPPRQAPSAWQLFFADELNKAKAAAAAEAGATPGGTPIHPKLNVAQIAKDAGAAYAGLDEERKAHYAQKVEEGKVQYQKDLITWQATLTPEDIKAENAFRAQQRKEGKSRKGNLKDPNAPKKPLSAYFLFLKGIRDNDDLRKSVWADETETTRQSVLAAARWRGLSDEEKRPYLQQAEKDKQEYEALRKVYEDDAAARARGEDVPDRPQFQEIHSAVINPPESLLKPAAEGDLPPKASPKTEKKPAPTKEGETATADTTDPVATATFTVPHEGSPDEVPAAPANFDASLEIEEFHGFDDMDLTGLEGMTGHGESGEAQWDHLGYMDGEGRPAAAASASEEEEKEEEKE